MARRSPNYHLELPFQADPPVLVDPELGIDQVRSQGEPVTLRTMALDSADERLLRNGILLARRETPEGAEWVLHAPSWRPWLPEQETVLGQSRIPEHFEELITPFRRYADLTPTVSVLTRQSSYDFLDLDGEWLATLIDERITIRRGEIATGRSRRVTVVPGDFDGAQREFVLGQLIAVGGQRVDSFPDPVQQMQTTGSELAVASESSREATLEQHLMWLFRNRLRMIITADLALRSGQQKDTGKLRSQLLEALDELRGLGGLLDREWAEGLTGTLEQLTALPVGPHIQVFGSDYLDLLDSLDLASQAPRVDAAAGSLPAAEVLRGQLEGCVDTLAEQLAGLTETSPEQSWRAALAQAEQLARVAVVATPVLGKVNRYRRAVSELIERLRRAQTPGDQPEEELLEGLTPAEAFQAGRRFQLEVGKVTDARAKLRTSWAGLLKALPSYAE